MNQNINTKQRNTSASESVASRERCSLSTISSLGEVPSAKPKVLTLQKDESGYGFFLKKILGSPMHVICDVDKGSPAEESGMRNGDVVGCVNGVDVMHDSHEECVRKIKDSGESVELTVASKAVMRKFYQHGITATIDDRESWLCLDDSTLSYTNAAFEDIPQIQTGITTIFSNHKDDDAFLESANPAINDLPNKDLNLPVKKSYPVLPRLTINSAGSQGQSPASSPPLPRVCKLRKSDAGYGFQLHKNPDTLRHIVSGVIAGSPADEAGLRNGDKIIEINHESIISRTHQEVLEIIASNESEVVLLVASDEEDAKSMEIKSNAREKFYGRMSSSVHECLLIKRPGEEFEFFLMVDTVRNAQVITDVAPGGPAERCGLKNGDTLIEVNGINVENTPHREVVRVIKENVKNNQIKFLVAGEKRSLYREKEDSCIIA